MDKVETAEHLKNEESAIKKFCDSKNCKFTKLPKYDIDFLIHKDGHGVAFAEVKCRTHNYENFPTQFLSFHKYQSLKDCGRWLPAYLICQYTNGIYFINIKDIPLNSIKLGGRNNPRPHCPNDIEFLIHFNRSLMKKIGNN
jgi:hypothetical protein